MATLDALMLVMFTPLPLKFVAETVVALIVVDPTEILPVAATLAVMFKSVPPIVVFVAVEFPVINRASMLLFDLNDCLVATTLTLLVILVLAPVMLTLPVSVVRPETAS